MQRKHLWISGITFVVVALLASATPSRHAAGQSAATKLTGKVVDAATGKPIAGAVIRIAPSGARVRAGADGRYVISGISAGRYTVRCSAPGYRSKVKRGIAMAAGDARVHDCRLQRQRPRGGDDSDAPSRPEAERSPAPVKRPAVTRGDSRGRAADRVSRRGSLGYKKFRSKQAPAAAAPRLIAPAPPPRQPMVAPPEMSREGYDKRDDNPFVATSNQPLSTFSIDVDTASYSNVRRFIEREGRLPPKDAVKIEELINYFSYDYPAPRGADPFSVHTEISNAPWNPAHRLVRIGLKGKEIATEKLPPSNLVFLIDVSGSMGSANKLPLLKSAFSLLVNELRPRDRVAIAVYAGAAGLVLPSTSGQHKDRILSALDQLRSGGSTAGAAGIHLAYQVARQNFIRGGNNRVILATDGDFNVGTSSDGELVRLIEDKRKQGVFLTVLGFGGGNYQDAKMEKLADKGNGNHAYIDSIREAKKVLVSEMGGTLFTIAKDVKLQIEFNPTKVKAYRLIGYENRLLAAQDFNDDKKDAGELGAGHTVTALYEIIPAGSREKVAGVDELKYQKVHATAAAASGELLTVKLRYKRPDGDNSKLIVHPLADRPVTLARTSTDFRFATSVAEFGMLLRGSEHKGAASYDRVIQLARGALGRDRQGYREGFLSLVRKAKKLAGGQPAIAR